ncbi:uncharacterized protein LAESUDRAFT_720129 [Laetiporus sulphureus 93-53]|uniref:Phytochrome n=1 Tax=Laetiporus sulphureus 93-53 TaxID=1314785 RepID=A0A165HT59_9APHY|nr:uncharacterized protein LAESUDRAFT_720129 [Laetiporus sulphureus 93-53]KZT12155.1 hypothetical protein LAESUDRAFT_720129 [Laetiporus sulphureus 93-53]
MSTEDDARRLREPSSSTSTSSSSYVYPVRSLLTGIRPGVGQRAEESARPRGDQHGKSLAALSIHEAPALQRSTSSGGVLSTPPASTSASESMSSAGDSPESEGHHHHHHHRRKPRTPNFRDFSLEEDPHSRRTFSTVHGSYFPRSPSGTTSPTHSMLYIPGPSGEPVEISNGQGKFSEDADDHDIRHGHRPHISEVAAEAFASTAEVLLTAPGLDDAVHAPFSHTGIVHLPPVGSHSAPSAPDSSCGRSGRSLGNRDGAGSGRASSSSQLGPGSQSDLDVAQLPSTRGSRPQSPMVTTDVTGSESSVSSWSGSDAPHIAFRYTHMEDEHGHHLILGREGKLTKCEDEPIRTPGAVQGFGVLIAVEEDEETGNLSVRQVSENSTELLGLSPQFLFSLECFTDTLPDQQSDVLFDNIQYLSDTSLSPEEQAENLHVFMLNGWGEPGTALEDGMSTDPQQRRSWSCWCAAHRPQMNAPANFDANGESSVAHHNLIVLEFELERDALNPLYPPATGGEGTFQSGISSPSDGSNAGTHSSGRTLVSTSSSEDRIITPDDLIPSRIPSSDPSVSSSYPGVSPTPSQETSAYGFSGAAAWMPSPEDIFESTTSRAKPLLALERLRRTRRNISSSDSPISEGQGSFRRGASRRRRGTGAVGMMDIFAVMAQINEQLGSAPDLDTFLKVVAGVIKDLTQFHRVLVYQFDELWNGRVVAELLDWSQTHELYRGLHFPASDIPAQARHLYALNKVRLLYDRSQPTARLVVRSKKDLETPLDMTHCYLRAMSPIHLKYLENMGVRASMSMSITAFGQLWGLVACHSYGSHGMRVSFPVRQMLRLLSQSISRNVERLSYAQRLHTRKLINTVPSDQHPTGYIVSDADDLLGLFDADYGVLVIGEGAKILGPKQHGQEILIVAEYLRLKQFDTIQVSQAVTQDYPDLQLSTGLEVIAGLLYVPLSAGGRDFIAFLRKGQPRQVRWAGRPYKDDEQQSVLEPRASFRMWSETVAGRCRAWTDEHLETAGVLALVYGKFIEVWRQKESALQTTKLTNLLLSNASHEVRTPLNHIINYLELALNGSLDTETRENLSQSHAASKSLLFTINDLLDLTRLESGHETSFNEAFDLHHAIEDATLLYRNEATRRGLSFKVDVSTCPRMVVGDARKIRTVVSNLTANALKYTQRGSISVQCHTYDEPVGLRDAQNVAVEIVVSDTGCGIPAEKLECIFREFEQVESASPKANSQGLGLGLAVVARIVEQLGGQLRVDSQMDEGSCFSFLIPFATEPEGQTTSDSYSPSSTSALQSRDDVSDNRGNEINNLVEAFAHHRVGDGMAIATEEPSGLRTANAGIPSRKGHDRPRGTVGSENAPKTATGDDLDTRTEASPAESLSRSLLSETSSNVTTHRKHNQTSPLPKLSASARKSGPMSSTSRSARSDNEVSTKLRLLIVEDNDINRMILAKRLSLDGHNVVNTTNGIEGVEMLESDWEFDCVLMDIQMPLLNGFEATERIRSMERTREHILSRTSHKLNGRIPIFAVSASLFEDQREELFKLGFDGWILKPIDFKRLKIILRGVVDTVQRGKDVYHPSCNWEVGGWLRKLDRNHEDL